MILPFLKKKKPKAKKSGGHTYVHKYRIHFCHVGNWEGVLQVHKSGEEKELVFHQFTLA